MKSTSSQQQNVQTEDQQAEVLCPPYGSRTAKRRVGRGIGSKRGRTSTRGHKGHRSRSGFKALPFFEGGQMPISRRLPKFGFSNSPFKKTYEVVSIKELALRFAQDAEITKAALKSAGLLKGKAARVKLTNKHKLSTLPKQFKIDLTEIKLTAVARKVLVASGSQLSDGRISAKGSLSV